MRPSRPLVTNGLVLGCIVATAGCVSLVGLTDGGSSANMATDSGAIAEQDASSVDASSVDAGALDAGGLDANAVSDAAVISVPDADGAIVMTPIYRINAGGVAATPFLADAFANGGTPYMNSDVVDTTSVANAAPAIVYSSYRYSFSGSFSYTFPGLESGKRYDVRLHFAEIYASDMTPGARLFNASINGISALMSFDVYVAAGGGDRALVKDFVVNADTNGAITIQFTPISGHDSAMVNGLEIWDEGGG